MIAPGLQGLAESRLNMQVINLEKRLARHYLNSKRTVVRLSTFRPFPGERHQ